MMAEMFAAWETHRRIILGRIPCLVSSPQEFDFDLRSCHSGIKTWSITALHRVYNDNLLVPVPSGPKRIQHYTQSMFSSPTPQ
ncbi:Uncharacterized protein HZ326_7654 [Fusarium oxysporum f. sp. albedinis]|nr:Uncharacterized protein HZ326_7654 [Fusarium oxysporum f. sp. albedinis]